MGSPQVCLLEVILQRELDHHERSGRTGPQGLETLVPYLAVYLWVLAWDCSHHFELLHWQRMAAPVCTSWAHGRLRHRPRTSLPTSAFLSAVFCALQLSSVSVSFTDGGNCCSEKGSESLKVTLLNLGSLGSKLNLNLRPRDTCFSLGENGRRQQEHPSEAPRPPSTRGCFRMFL